MRRLNSDKDRAFEREGMNLGGSALGQIETSNADLTDKEDVYFRYSY
jgi:hypothetical protein